MKTLSISDRLRQVADWLDRNPVVNPHNITLYAGQPVTVIEYLTTPDMVADRVRHVTTMGVWADESLPNSVMMRLTAPIGEGVVYALSAVHTDVSDFVENAAGERAWQPRARIRVAVEDHNLAVVEAM